MQSLSIWLVPDQNTLANLKPKVTQLAAEHHFADFSPHLTLVNHFTGDLESTIAAVTNVARNQPPLDLQASEISWSTTYWQCVFLRITPTVELLQLRQNLLQQVSIEEAHFYMPHISLVYGTMDLASRSSIASELQQEMQFPFAFSGAKIAIIKADTNPQNWEVLFEMELRTSQPPKMT